MILAYVPRLGVAEMRGSVAVMEIIRLKTINTFDNYCHNANSTVFDQFDIGTFSKNPNNRVDTPPDHLTK
jgi:hypothetical protein